MDFNQQYPTVEETGVNNALVLAKRRKFFMAEARADAKWIGFLFITIIYLRDALLMGFILRMAVQYINSLQHLPQELLEATHDIKRASSKVKVVFSFLANGICIFFHLVFGAYHPGDLNGGDIHGAVTLQFIGEPVRRGGYLTLLLLDVIVFVLQMYYFVLANDSEVGTTTTTLEAIEDHKDGDGYTGNLQLFEVDVVGSVQRTLAYAADMNAWMYPSGMLTRNVPSLAQELSVPIPGTFPSQAFG